MSRTKAALATAGMFAAIGGLLALLALAPMAFVWLLAGTYVVALGAYVGRNIYECFRRMS